MNIVLDQRDLDPLVDRIVAAVESRLTSASSNGNGQLLWSEADAAKALGVSPFFLKDARQQGHIESHTTKRPILYTRAQIEAVKEWLAKR